MIDEAATYVVDIQSEEGQQMAALVEVFRAAIADHLGEHITADMVSHVMTAAVMFGGTMFGTAIAAGLATPQDKRRCTEAMARNFRTGIDVGLRRAERIGVPTVQ